nr:MAG TPA: minor tail protein [Caudoviricetes sp.]
MADRDLTARFSASTAGFTAGTNVLKQKLTELNTNMEQTKQAVKQANSEMKEYQKELQNLRKDTNNGATATKEQRDRMQELRDNIARTSSEIGTLRTAEQELRSQIRNANREFENQQTAVQQVQSAAASMGDVLKANLYSSAIQSAVRKLISSLQSAARYCYDVGSSFEAGMSQVAAISGATASELDQLTAKAKELGASTKFTATQVSEAMNYMAMAGWNAEQMLSGIDGVMNLAAASGGDLAQTSDIVTDAITAFGLKAEDVGHFADVLAAASANANTNVAMMGETFSYCAPIAGALGFSIEDVSEAIGLMANSGVKSSMAGTALRTLFTKLSDDIKITGQNLGEVTIQTSNADGTMRELTDILTDMRGAFSQLTQSEKSSAAESIAGKYAMTGLLTLMNAGAGDVDKLRGAIENCDGATADMADTMQNNVSGAVTIMQSALEGLGIAVYDKFGEKLKDTLGDMTDIFSDITQRIENGDLDQVFERVANAVGNAADQLVDFAADSLPGFIEGLANVISFLVEYRNVIAGVVGTMVTFKTAMAIGRTITGLTSAIKGVTTAVRTAEIATQALTTAQAANNAVAAANPYVTIAAAVLALVGGLITLISTTDEATDKVADLRDKTDELNRAAQDSKKAADDLGELVEEYKELKTSTDDTEEAKQRLKEIQDILIDTYDAEYGKLDLVNGKYEEQLGLINDIADKKDEEARRDAVTAYNAYREQEKAESDITYKDKSNTIDGYTFGGPVFGEPIFSYQSTALRDERVRKMFSDLSDGSDNISLGKESITINGNGAPDYNVSVSGGTTEKYEAYKAIVEAFEARGLDKAGGEISKYYNDYVSMYKKYKEAYETNREIEENYFSAINKGVYGDTKAFNDYYYKNPSDNTDDKETSSTSSDEKKSGTDWSDINSVKKYYKYMKDTEQISDTDYYRYLEHYGNKLLDPDSDEWRTLMAEIYQGRKNINKGTGSGSATTKDPNEEQYDSDKKYLKWRLDMGYITEEEYYENLADLRDKYLDESSDKWRSATLEIKKYQEQKNKEKLDTIKDQYDSAIAAVDAEMKLHEREKEDEEVDKKIADIDRQLQYDRLDDYSRSQLEKKKQELLDEKEETQWQRDHEDLKDGLETVYTMAQDAYANSSAQLQDALSVASQVFGAIGTGATQTATAMNTVNNNSVNLVMNAVAQSSEQIAQAVVRLLSSGI